MILFPRQARGGGRILIYDGIQVGFLDWFRVFHCYEFVERSEHGLSWEVSGSVGDVEGKFE